MTERYDVAIIGAGPAGLTAATYTGRAMLKTALYEKGAAGGLMAITDKIENYPGAIAQSGAELAEAMLKQALSFGAELKLGDTQAITHNGTVFTITATEGVVEARSVIYAAGSIPKQLGVPGESAYIGRGVSYCAVCDGAFYRNLRVAVIGGGDSSLKEALFLTRFASEVVIIHRRQEFRAEKIIQDAIRNHPKIKVILDSVVESVEGGDFVERLHIKNVKTGHISTEPFDGMFVFIGYTPQTVPVQSLVELSDRGRILTDAVLMTKTPGLFAAGDVREKLVYQVATAVGDGATAATAAEQFLAGHH